MRNVCVTTTINLDTLHSGTLPFGATLLWSTDGDPSNGISSITPAVTAHSGPYFAYYYDATNQCYSPPSTAVNVQTYSCDPFLANLSVTKTTNVTSLTPGLPFSYLITVVNNGPSRSPNVILTEVIPAGAVVNAVIPSAGGVCTNTAGTIRCTWVTLAYNASATVTITLTP